VGLEKKKEIKFKFSLRNIHLAAENCSILPHQINVLFNAVYNFLRFHLIISGYHLPNSNSNSAMGNKRNSFRALVCSVYITDTSPGSKFTHSSLKAFVCLFPFAQPPLDSFAGTLLKKEMFFSFFRVLNGSCFRSVFRCFHVN
jgi:hypothetical protein